MAETQLPPVYVKRENKRLRVDGPGSRCFCFQRLKLKFVNIPGVRNGNFEHLLGNLSQIFVHMRNIVRLLRLFWDKKQLKFTL
jgi:hypothetical protein